MLHPALAFVGPAQGSPRRIDHEAARRAVGDLLRALGADDRSDGLRDTPRRVAEAYAELLTPQLFEATTFLNEDGYDELVIAPCDPVPLIVHASPAPVPRGRARRLPAG